jgi:putative DNA primase/helicase
VTDADVDPFLAHAERLLPNKDERDVVLAWMAWVLQNPRAKIRWSPVLKGPQGMGKDTLFKVLAEGVGFHNFEEVRPDKLGEKFTSFYERRVVLVTEMSNSDRHNVYERIKAAITGSAAGYLWVERKGIDPYPTLDRVAWVILTNHDDAISMAPDDRRFYVAETAVGDPPGREYFDDLYAWLEGNGGEGYRKAVTWLRQRDCSIITPNRPPAATEAKMEMTWNNLPVFAKWFAEQLADGDTIWGKRTVLSIGEVQKWMDVNSHLVPHKVAQHYHPRMVREALKAAGWSEFPARLDVGMKDRRVRHRAWTAPSCPSEMPREAVVARYIREAAISSGLSPFDVADGPSDTGAGEV